MTQLAIQYPLRYFDIFDPLTDFEVWDTKLLMTYSKGKTFASAKDVWLDHTSGEGMLEFFPCIATRTSVVGVILPKCDEPGRHLLNQARSYVQGKLNIGIWIGEKRHLELLKEAVDIVAIPYWEPRSVYVSPDDARLYHFYEFCNLDELRRLKPRSLHTSVPITAACMGIDLRDRERRPKKLPPFSYDMQLTQAQIDLAIRNIQSIREALDEPRRN